MVIEVENRSAVAVALAFAFVPVGLFGPGEISELSVTGSTITVDGRVGGILPSRCPPCRRPTRDHLHPT